MAPSSNEIRIEGLIKGKLKDIKDFNDLRDLRVDLHKSSKQLVASGGRALYCGLANCSAFIGCGPDAGFGIRPGGRSCRVAIGRPATPQPGSAFGPALHLGRETFWPTTIDGTHWD